MADTEHYPPLPAAASLAPIPPLAADGSEVAVRWVRPDLGDQRSDDAALPGPEAVEEGDHAEGLAASPSGMTVDDLIAELRLHSNDGGGADPIYIETHGRSYPLTRTEPTDGLEAIMLIGYERGAPSDSDLSMYLSDLDLSIRTYNALNREGIRIIADLMQYREVDLWDIRNLGVKSIQEIMDKLTERGLQLLPDDSEQHPNVIRGSFWHRQ
jgi:hypothetical protein